MQHLEDLNFTSFYFLYDLFCPQLKVIEFILGFSIAEGVSQIFRQSFHSSFIPVKPIH